MRAVCLALLTAMSLTTVLAAPGGAAHPRRHQPAGRTHLEWAVLLVKHLRPGDTADTFEKWLGARRPLARHYHDAVVNQNRFRRVLLLKDTRPGDVLAIR